MKKKDKYSVSDTLTELNAVSATECTGLIPTDPENDEQLNNYKEICPMGGYSE